MSRSTLTFILGLLLSASASFGQFPNPSDPALTNLYGRGDTSAPELITNATLNRLVTDYRTNALALFEFVVNNIQFTDRFPGEWASLSRKGALGTYLEGQGNDVDQSSLLVYLLRKCGIPSLYCSAEILMTATNANRVFGVDLIDDPSGANLYALGGQPNHYVFVGAYVNTGSSSNWVFLFPWSKTHVIDEGTELRTVLGYSRGARDFLEDYFDRDAALMGAGGGSDQVITILPNLLQTNLVTVSPTNSLDQIGARWRIQQQHFTNWPDYSTEFYLNTNSAPFNGRPLVYYTSLPDTRREKIQIVLSNLTGSAQTLITDRTYSTIELHNRRVTVSPSLASLSDTNRVNTYGSFYAAQNAQPSVPLNLNVLLNLGGTEIFPPNTWGLTPLNTHLGNTVVALFKHHTLGPPSAQVNASTVQPFGGRAFPPGNYEAFVFDFGYVSKKMMDVHLAALKDTSAWLKTNTSSSTRWSDLDREQIIGRPLTTVGMNYYHLIGTFGKDAEALTKVRSYGRLFIGSVFFSDVQVPGSYGPNSVGLDMFSGLLNGDLYLHYAPETNETFEVQHRQDLFLLQVAQNSAWEHGVLESVIGQTNSASTVKLIQAAKIQGGSWTNFNASNYLNFRTYVTNVNQGAWATIVNHFQPANHPNGDVYFPSTNGHIGTYTGTGWLLLDVNTNDFRWSAQYLISGFNNGGYSQSLPNQNLFQPSISLTGTLIPPSAPPSDLLSAWAGPGRSSVSGEDLFPVYIDYFRGNDVSFGQGALPITALETADGHDYRSVLDLDLDGFNGSTVQQSQNSLADFFQTSGYQPSVLNSPLLQQGQNSGPAYALHAGLDTVVSVAPASDPVNTMSGEFYVDETDLAVVGNFPIRVRRSYSSRTVDTDVLGIGWLLNHHHFLTLNTNLPATSIRAVEDDGTVLEYTLTSGVYKVLRDKNPSIANQNVSGIGARVNPLGNTITNASGLYTLKDTRGFTRKYQTMSFPQGPFTRQRPYLIEWRDPNDNYLTYTYGTDSSRGDYGQIIEILNNSGNFLRFTYDFSGRLDQVLAGDGRIVRYFYDSNGDLIGVVRPDQTEVRYEYGRQTSASTPFSNHLLTRIINPDGRILENVFETNACRRVLFQRSTVAGNAVPVLNATFLYVNNFSNAVNSSTNKVSGATTVTDALGRSTVYVYTNSVFTSITDARGNVQTMSWDSNRNLTNYVDLRGVVTRLYYDANGNVTNKVMVGDFTGAGGTQSLTNRYTYAPVTFRLLSVADPLGGTNVFKYDSKQNLASIARVNRAGVIYETTTNRYNSAGNLIATTRAWGTADASTNSFRFNQWGLPIAVTNAIGGVTSYTYDVSGMTSRGQVLAVDGPRTDVTDITRTTYDAMNRPLTVTDPLNHTVRTTYDRNGNRVRVEGPRPGVSTGYFYDQADRLIATMLPLVTDSEPTVNNGPEMPVTPTTFNAHDLLGNLTSVTDPRGAVTVIGYDVLNRATSRIEASGTPVERTLRFGYDAAGSVTNAINGRGDATRTRYNAAGKPIQIIDALSRTNRVTYDKNGNLVSTIDPNGHQTLFGYDHFDRLVATTNKNASGTVLRTESRTYDRRNNLITLKDPRNNVTSNVYDKADRIVATYLVNSAGVVVRRTDRTYTLDGLLGTEKLYRKLDGTDTLTTVYTYDAAGRLIDVAYPDNTQEQFVLDEAGNRTSVINRVQKTSDFVYDNLNRLTATLLPQVSDAATGGAARPTTVQGYDRNGNLVRSIDPRGNATRRPHDPLNRLLAVEQPFTFNGYPSTFFTYDAADNLVEVVDPESLVTAYQYDALQRVTSQSLRSASGQTLAQWQHKYDANGNRTNTVDARGVQINRLYDGLDRLTSLSFPAASAENVTFKYDRSGNLTNMVEASGTTTRTYDAAGLLLRETTTAGLTTRTRDAAGNRTLLTFPGSHAVTNRYDNGNRPNFVQSGALIATFTYNGLGQMLSATYPNTLTRTNVYDAASRLVSSLVVKGAITNLYQQWGYDLSGNRFKLTEKNQSSSNYNVTNRYDNLNSLTNETHTMVVAATTNHYSANYQYDQVGNRWQETVRTNLPGTVATNAYTYDARYELTGLGFATNGTVVVPISGIAANTNRFTLAVSGATTASYTISFQQALGTWTTNITFNTGSNAVEARTSAYTNRTSFVVRKLANGSQAFTYDPNGNLKVWIDGGVTRTNTYDSLNRLVKIDYSNGSPSDQFFYDGLNRRVRMIVGGVNRRLIYDGDLEVRETDTATGAEKAWWLRGPDMGGGIGGLLYYSRNGQVGYPIADTRGNIVLVTDATGGLRNGFVYTGFKQWQAYGTNTYQDVHGFSSKWVDASKLIFFGQRYYHPTVGRFTTMDPLGAVDGANRYLYVRNNPLTLLDPLGLYAGVNRNVFNFVTGADPNLSFGEQIRQAAEFARFEQANPGLVSHPLDEYFESLPAALAGPRFLASITPPGWAVLATDAIAGGIDTAYNTGDYRDLGVAVGVAILPYGVGRAGQFVGGVRAEMAAVRAVEQAGAKTAGGAADDIMVIGRMTDTTKYQGKPGYNILNLPLSQWNIVANDAWTQAGIHTRSTFKLATDINFKNLTRRVQLPDGTFRHEAAVYLREMKMLRDAGYVRQGDLMVPPPLP